MRIIRGMVISSAELEFLRSLPKRIVERRRATHAHDGREQMMARWLEKLGLIKLMADSEASTRDALVVSVAATEAGEEVMRAARGW